METTIKLGRKYQWKLSLVREGKVKSDKKPWWKSIHSLHVLLVGTIGLLIGVFTQPFNFNLAVWIVCVSGAIIVASLFSMVTYINEEL